MKLKQHVNLQKNEKKDSVNTLKTDFKRKDILFGWKVTTVLFICLVNPILPTSRKLGW